jgi:hypothetical protein
MRYSLGGLIMATQQLIFTNEGEALFAEMLFKNTARTAGLELLLFTKTTVDETTTYAQLAATEPTGGSYARIPLDDGSWNLANGVLSYPPKTFTPVGSAFVGNIQGAAIVTKGISPNDSVAIFCERFLWHPCQ